MGRILSPIEPATSRSLMLVALDEHLRRSKKESKSISHLVTVALYVSIYIASSFGHLECCLFSPEGEVITTAFIYENITTIKKQMRTKNFLRDSEGFSV